MVLTVYDGFFKNARTRYPERVQTNFERKFLHGRPRSCPLANSNCDTNVDAGCVIAIANLLV